MGTVEDDPLIAELRDLELALARRDLAGLPGTLDELIDEEFLEFGSSGRRWDRASIVEEIAASIASGRPGEVQLEIEDFTARRIADEVALVTYWTVERRPGRASTTVYRSSIWLRRDGAWRIRFHQGTPTAPAG